jgi:hypothetical protein
MIDATPPYTVFDFSRYVEEIVKALEQLPLAHTVVRANFVLSIGTRDPG